MTGNFVKAPLPPRIDVRFSAASFLLSSRDVNYIAELYGQVTDAFDPEHGFSVFGVGWWNVEGHYVTFAPRGGGGTQLSAFASAVRWARASANMASRVAAVTFQT